MIYEYMKHFAIAGACGIIIGLDLFGIYYWIKTLVVWIRKKIKEHRHPEVTAENKQ